MNTRRELQRVPGQTEIVTRQASVTRPDFIGEMPGEPGIAWRSIGRILRKHWVVFASFAIGLEVLLLVIVLMMKNTYESKTVLEIEPPTSQATSLRDVGGVSQTQQDYLDTQLEILKGDHLALVVIRDLRLDQNATFLRDTLPERIWSKAVGVFSRKSSDDADVEKLLKKFKGGLQVNQVKSSRLVQVGFESTDPKLSTQITQQVANQYLEELHRSKYDATLRAAKSVAPELEDLKNSVTKSGQDLVDFQKKHEGVALATQGAVTGDGTSDGGGQAGGNPVATRVAQLNQQLTTAMGDRIQQEAYMKLIRQGANDSLPQMKDNQLIQDLTKRSADSRAQLAELLAVYGGNNPQVRKAQQQTEALNAALSAERNRIVSQIKQSYESAVNRENLLRSTLNGMKGELDASNADAVKYDVLRREAQANSNLYITLSSRIKELAVSGTLSANNVRILEDPREPIKPSGPHRFRILGGGLILGLIGGMVLAFVAEGMDDTISTMDDVKRWSGLPALALVPESEGPRPKLNGARSAFALNGARNGNGLGGPILQFVNEKPHSPEAEAIRSLETAIRLQSQPPNQPVKVITVTSAFPGEGKTTLAVNLAHALAKHNKVCLIDTDLRHPAITGSFALGERPGLQDLLTKQDLKETVLASNSGTANLVMIGAGRPIMQPLEAVTSKQMVDLVDSLRERFDYILLDTPPVIPFADTRWISALSDGVVLVARSSTTTRKGLTWGMEILDEINARILGVVLNGADLQSEFYGYGAKHYYRYAGQRV